MIFTNEHILAWMNYFSKEMDLNLEKIKLLNICEKKRNIIPSIETHKRVMIFADESQKQLCYDLWEAGLGDCEVYYGTGEMPSGELTASKISDMISYDISGPTVLLIVNANTRETYHFGIKNENFSRGPIHYVGSEIRAVIMSLLHVDTNDCICVVSGESIVIEAAIAASEGTIIAVENDLGSKNSMHDNTVKFGVHNVEIVTDLNRETLSKLPVPRLAFIVAGDTLEDDIKSLLAINPHMEFVIYTLELDILSSIKGIFERNKIKDMEVLQISVSKADKNSVFVAQPSPWLISGKA